MDMSRTSFLLLSSVSLFLLFGCASGRMGTVQEGRTTWRSSRLPVDRSGGAIEVVVTGSLSGDVTVFLLEPEAVERMHDTDVDPVAAAEGPLRAEGFSVTFTGLPTGEYVVGAFMDMDDDGTLVHAGSLFSSGYAEPHSRFPSIEVGAASRQKVELVIPKESS